MRQAAPADTIGGSSIRTFAGAAEYTLCRGTGAESSLVFWQPPPLEGLALVALIACSSVLFSFVLSVVLFFAMGDSQPAFNYTAFDWISTGNLSVSFSLLVDPLSILMMLIITGVGFLIHVYSTGYMHGDEGFNRFFAYLNLFITMMLLLVLAQPNPNLGQLLFELRRNREHIAALV